MTGEGFNGNAGSAFGKWLTDEGLNENAGSASGRASNGNAGSTSGGALNRIASSGSGVLNNNAGSSSGGASNGDAGSASGALKKGDTVLSRKKWEIKSTGRGGDTKTINSPAEIAAFLLKEGVRGFLLEFPRETREKVGKSGGERPWSLRTVFQSTSCTHVTPCFTIEFHL